MKPEVSQSEKWNAAHAGDRFAFLARYYDRLPGPRWIGFSLIPALLESGLFVGGLSLAIVAWAFRQSIGTGPPSLLVFAGSLVSLQLIWHLLHIYPFDNLRPASGHWTAISNGRLLGLTSQAMEKLADAHLHFEEALTFCRRASYRPELAWTCCDYADMLLERDDEGDRSKAATLLDESLGISSDLGMRPLMERVLSRKMSLQGIDVSSPQTSIDAVVSVVEVERPNLAPHAAPDGTVTVMFTDIEGSTAVTERLGDQKAQEIIHTHNAIIREQVAANQGFEVKSQGDGFMVAFSSAKRALECAVAHPTNPRRP